uniref:Uncharacterized protein n=1 Tax=Mesocestoides corti TaxID=53468 RepID=A0A5K3ERK3_MESCO
MHKPPSSSQEMPRRWRCAHFCFPGSSWVGSQDYLYGGVGGHDDGKFLGSSALVLVCVCVCARGCLSAGFFSQTLAFGVVVMRALPWQNCRSASAVGGVLGSRALKSPRRGGAAPRLSLLMMAW